MLNHYLSFPSFEMNEVILCYQYICMLQVQVVSVIPPLISLKDYTVSFIHSLLKYLLLFDPVTRLGSRGTAQMNDSQTASSCRGCVQVSEWHSEMLCVHFFICLLRFFLMFSCRMVFENPRDLVTCTYHLRLSSSLWSASLHSDSHVEWYYCGLPRW